jgi:ABC-2 type transport system ATP-binding protein
MSVIEMRGLRKDFTVRVKAGRFRRSKRTVSAVDGVDLSIAAGEMVGYIGPNGAGKSTTLKMLTGILTPTAGTVSVCGLSPVPQRTRLALRIGVVFGQRSQLWWDLPLRESFTLLRHIYRVPAADHAARLTRCRTLLDLDEFLDTPVRQLSLGQRMRGELTAALLHAPEVLFLDEPTIGLDPQTRRAIWDYLHDLRRRTEITVFVTTHYMDEAEHCDRIAIMDHGRIVVEDTPEALKSSVGTDRIALRTDDDELTISRLRERLGVEAARHEGQVTLAVAEGAQVVPRLFTELDVVIQSVTVTRPSLDDVFMTYTGRTIRDSEGPQSLAAMFAGRR